jgi:hypothetical protein
MLDRAAGEVRELDTLDRPESMQFRSCGVRVEHALELDEDPASPGFDGARSEGSK